jgi:hypothetical protein
MKNVLLATAVFSLLCIHGVSCAVVLYPMADSPTLSAEPDTNFNGCGGSLDAELWTGIFGGTVDSRGYLKFNLTGLPAVNSATLWLYNGVGCAQAADISAYSTGTAWSEGTLTWNNQPAPDAFGTAVNVGSAMGWYSWDVTSLIRPQAGSRASIALVSSGEAHIFHARETETGYMPYLDVDCTVPEPATLALFCALLPLVMLRRII